MTSDLDNAYRATTYRVFLPGGVVDLRIGVVNPTLAAWLADEEVETWAILTACNPASERRSEAENCERQAQLECVLLEAGFEPFAGENLADDDAWPAEDTCFVADIDREEAGEMAAEFGQNAMVYGEADGVPQLVWIENN